MALGQRVEELRKDRGWTQVQLCAAAGGAITQQNLDRLEKRDAKTSEAAPALADALGVSLRWLLTGEGRKTDTDWPFGSRVQRSRWDACTDEDRGYVQAAVNRALDECEAARLGEFNNPYGNRNPPTAAAA